MKKVIYLSAICCIIFSNIFAQGYINDFAGFKKLILGTSKEFILPYVDENFKLEKSPTDMLETYFIKVKDTVNYGYIQFENDSLFQAVKVWETLPAGEAFEVLWIMIAQRRDYSLNPKYNIQPYVNQYFGPFFKKTLTYKSVFDGYSINFEYDTKTKEVVITEVISKI
ncbi:MAG: hypothetical protein JXA68_10240 [Ignavibacteriales bacterium]|nr:hypothetical protein [Ignavibacteriales bacterium]